MEGRVGQQLCYGWRLSRRGGTGVDKCEHQERVVSSAQILPKEVRPPLHPAEGIFKENNKMQVAIKED